MTVVPMMLPWQDVTEIAALVLTAYFIGCTAGFLLRLAVSRFAVAPQRTAIGSGLILAPSEQFSLDAVLRPTPVQRLAANIVSSSGRPTAPARPVFTTVSADRRSPQPATSGPTLGRTGAPIVLAAAERGGPSSERATEPEKPGAAQPAKPPPRAGFGKPEALASSRGGRKDNLRLIRNIGPRIERGLNDLGVFHFDQIAAWDRKTVLWVENHFSFRGRIEREKWVAQASELCSGTARRPRQLRA
jgi:predicted flap endonuclease-1-like 5' DNA nuclease